jgi:hypothetical protein
MGRKLQQIKKRVNTFIDALYTDKVSIITPTLLTKTAILKLKPSHIDDEVWIQSCRWIVHSIIQLSFDKRYNQKEEAYVSLYSVVLKKNCGNNYYEYIKGLIDGNIISCDGKYSKKTHESFGFKITDKYSCSQLKYITLTEPFLVKRIRAFRKERIAELKTKAAPIASLIRWLTDYKLYLDTSGALEFLEIYKKTLKKELDKRHLKPKYRKAQEAFVLKRYYKIKSQIENWNTNKYLSIDDAGGRLYSPLTSLPSIFRNFLSYDGEQLISIDIKNSQPFHFLLMLKPSFWKSYGTGLTLKKLDPVLYKYQSNGDKKDVSNIMFPKISKIHTSKGSEEFTFKKMVLIGKLYEFICFKLFGKHITKSGLDRFSTRSLTKKEVLRLMYFDPKKVNPPVKAIFKDFKSLFPVEAGIMEILKERKYNDFPVLLQKIEAQMLLHKASNAIFKYDPTIPLFSIHDSLVTTQRHQQTVITILKREYEKQFGCSPQLEITKLKDIEADFGLMKYIKSKVDREDITISDVNDKYKDIFKFLKCEHWDFERKYYSEKIPDFAKYITSV